MTRHVHLLPAGRVETECIAEVLNRAGLDARTGPPESECRGPVVVLQLDGLAAEPVARDYDCVLVTPLSGSTAAVVTRIRSVLQAEATATRPRRHLERTESLTPRELEIASLLACGWRNVEIADELGISSNTVRTHAQRVLAKLDVQHRQALAVKLPHGVSIPSPRRSGGPTFGVEAR